MKLAVLVASVAVVVAHAGEPMRILDDQMVMRCLPRKHLFENIDDKLMRNAAGTQLHLGPGEEREFFIVSGLRDWKKIEAPSTGEAYLGTNGTFAVWYDSLTNGVHFADGRVLHIDDPLTTRFGVDYDATLCYVAHTNRSEVFRTSDPFTPLYRIDDAYVYKIARHERDVVAAGYRYIRGDYKREHRWWRHRDVDGEWLLMADGSLPEAMVVADADPAGGRLLLMQESVVVTRLHEYDLRTGALSWGGEVDGFGIYMSRAFNAGADRRMRDGRP